MRKFALIAVISLMLTPRLFAANGTPWNNDYPCPDMDCSTMSADFWAGGMYSCSVKAPGGCVDCAIDLETNRAVCVKIWASEYCECKTAYNSKGVRTCTARNNCKYLP